MGLGREFQCQQITKQHTYKNTFFFFRSLPLSLSLGFFGSFNSFFVQIKKKLVIASNPRFFDCVMMERKKKLLLGQKAVRVVSCVPVSLSPFPFAYFASHRQKKSQPNGIPQGARRKSFTHRPPLSVRASNANE